MKISENKRLNAKINFTNEEAMQKKQVDTILINGQEIPTTSYLFKVKTQIEKQSRKAQILTAISIVLLGISAIVQMLSK
jgi:hypothetical protein